jgi:hypothetical protein
MTWQIFFWIVAVILFVLAALGSWRAVANHVVLVPLGLAFFVLGFLQPLLG